MNVAQALIDAQVVTAEQIEQANTLGRTSLAQSLIECQALEERAYVDVVARAFEVESADVESVRPSAEILALVPESTARSASIVPLERNGDTLVVATPDPGNRRALERIARGSGLRVATLVAGPGVVAAALDRLYGRRGSGGRGGRSQSADELERGVRRALQEIAVDEDDADQSGDLLRLILDELDPPVVRVVHGLLLKALGMGASDIHIEPMEDEVRVRFRIDGAMIEVLRAPSDMRNALVSRIKIMAEMDIAEKRLPQDGGIKVILADDSTIDFRVSSLPNIYGEKMVLRLLGHNELRPSVDALGFQGRALEHVREAIANPHGMILVTGPTGSGKTTSLYTMLNQLNEDDVNIVTAEDPVEYRLPGITQVGIRPAAGLTFDRAMRSFLRQDPDIILVGEMRDYETAAIAVKAALTGHLVLSTLHTNDAPSSVVRMVDMGIEPYLVASAVKLVVAQRLVRTICPNCRVDVDVGEAERSDLAQSIIGSIEYLSRGEGCDLCHGIGYRGRRAVFEVMSIHSKEMKRAITEGGTEVQVSQIARREGMMSLSENAVDLVNRGVTTLEEARGLLLGD